MTDISLSVGLDTGKANGTLTNLIKKLEAVDKANDKLIKSNDRLRDSFNKVGTGAKFAMALLGKYKAQLDSLAKTNGSLITSSNSIANALGGLGTSSNKAGNSLNGLDVALQKVIKKSTSFGDKLRSTHVQMGHLKKAFDNGKISAAQYAGGMKSLESRIMALQSASQKTNKALANTSTTTVAATKGTVGYNKGLDKTSRAAFRAASANKENNAILSDQVGFWRFAARGAALYFSSLATDRLIAVNLEMQQLQQALNAIGGSQEAGAQSMEFISDTAQRLGLEINSLGAGYKQLSAATKGTALEGAIAEDIFESVAEAASVMKLSAADTDGVMRALSQIMSKGKVSSEELRQQLGDRLPGAFQTAAKAMNVTTAELNKMLEDGKVISEDFLPKFAKELRNTFTATPELLNGPQQAINRMKNSFVQLAIDIGEAGLNEAIIKISNSLAEFAEGETAQKLVETLGSAAVWVANNIEDLTDTLGVLFGVLAAKTVVNTGVDMYSLAKSMGEAGASASKLQKGFTGLLATAAAFGVGFQVGDIIVNQFNGAREAGSYLVQGLLAGWEILKTGTEIVWNSIELSVKSVFLGIPALAIEAINATINNFKSLASYLDDTFGTDLVGSIDFEGLEIDNEPLAQLTTEILENKEAWEELKTELSSQNELFEEQRKLFKEQGLAAEKAGMTIGEYLKSIEDAEKALAKKAKTDAKAAKRAKELAKAEKELDKVRKAADIKKALEDYDDLIAKYDKESKAAQEQKEALAELKKIKDLGAISGNQFLQTQEKIKESFQSQLNPVKDITDEMDNLEKAYSTFSDEARATAMFKALERGFDEDVSESIAEATKNLEDFKKELDFKKQASLFNNLLEGFEDISKGLGETLSGAVLDGDWNSVGADIGGMLSGAIGNSLAGATSGLLSGLGSLAGPIGSVLGGFAEGLLNTFISEGFSGTVFGDVKDPTEARQAALGTGTVLGDGKAKSESIVKSLDIISKTNQEIVSINTGMLKSLSGFSSGINSAIATIAGVDLGAGIQAPTANEDIGNLLAGGITFGIPNMGSLATDFLDIFSFGLFSAIGDALGGKVKQIDEGVQILGGYLTDLTNNTVVEAFATFKEKKHAFDDYDKKERTAGLDQGVSDQFTSLFVQIADSVAVGAESLGLSADQVDGIFSNFQIDTTKISLEGLDVEGQTEALNSFFSGVFDELTLATIPWLEGMQKAGEGLGETLTRVSTEFGLAQEAYAVLGFGVADTMGEIWGPVATAMLPLGDALKDMAVPTELLVQASSDLIAKAGGIEAFSSSLASFEQNFLEPAEQISNQGRRLSSALTDIGLELPNTREGFRELFEAQEAMTDSGRQNIATLLNLEGAADSYYNLLENQTANLANIRDLELRLMQAQGDEAGLLAAKRQDELDALEGLANADEAKELLEQIWELEDAASAAGESIQDLSTNLQSMVDAAVDAFFALDFQAFNLDGSDLTAAQIEQASEALVNGVGDINSFNAAVSSFSSNFLTEEAKFTKSSSNVANAFAKYNAVIPETRQGFTDLFQSLNAVTDANAIADALKIAEDANTYYAFLEKQAESIYNLELRLLQAQGEETAALAKTRQKELDAASDTEKSLLRQIFAAEDLAKANEERLERESELLQEVADVQDRINDAYREQIDNLDATATRMRGLNESLRDFGSDVALGSLSALSPQEQLALARSDFESTASAAQSGDINALERLQSVATAFLEESREFQGSGGTFADDFARVQDVIANSATVADIQADQAERQSMLMERQLERQQENNEDTKSIKEALLALIAVQKESGLLSLSELEAMKRSLNILESNSSLSTSQI